MVSVGKKKERGGLSYGAARTWCVSHRASEGLEQLSRSRSGFVVIEVITLCSMEGPSTTPKLASTEVPVLVDEPPETPPSVDLGLVDTPHEAGESHLVRRKKRCSNKPVTFTHHTHSY